MEQVTARRDLLLIAALVVLVAALFAGSLAVGPVVLSPADVVGGLFGRANEAANIIVREIRLPRAILSLMIGGTLGLSGAALQGLLRNPLAAPSLFGAPVGGGVRCGHGHLARYCRCAVFALPVAAIAGALVSVGLLILVAGPRASLLVLILAGLAISSLAGAGTSLALNLAPNPFAALEIAFWLLGSLEDRSMRHVWIALPFMVVGVVLLMWDRRAFRALTLGEEAAASLGFDLTWIRLRVVAGVAAAVGAGVAVAGSIGFVGLVAPHLMRPFVGYDPGRLLIPAALSGAALLTASDIVVRLIPSQEEIKVGVLTALIGAPFFIFLMHAAALRFVGSRGMNEPALSVTGLSVSLGRRTVLTDVSLSIAAGTFVAIIGPNGAGKTTLLRAIAGLVPSRGEIVVAGAPLPSLPLQVRAQRIAYLPQGHVFHWPLTVAEIVALGRLPRGAGADLSAADRSAVAAAMAETGTTEYATRPVTTLSGGERARVAMARVLATEAPIILADEPTASLDARLPDRRHRDAQAACAQFRHRGCGAARSRPLPRAMPTASWCSTADASSRTGPHAMC